MPCGILQQIAGLSPEALSRFTVTPKLLGVELMDNIPRNTCGTAALGCDMKFL